MARPKSAGFAAELSMFLPSNIEIEQSDTSVDLRFQDATLTRVVLSKLHDSVLYWKPAALIVSANTMHYIWGVE